MNTASQVYEKVLAALIKRVQLSPGVDKSEYVIKVTDLVEDNSSLLLLDFKWLTMVATEATIELAAKGFRITFDNPGKYRVTCSSIPGQR